MSSEESHEVNVAPENTGDCPRLISEGSIPVLYKGIWVKKISFDKDEITVGVMDPENDIYPDINLRQYRLEGGDPYISRRHGRFFQEEGKYYIEDICKNNSTSVDSKSNIINGDKRELFPGTRIFISESIAFRFETASEIEEEKETPSDQEKPEEAENQEPEVSETTEPEAESSETEVAEEKQSSEAMSCYIEVEGQIPLYFKPRNIFTHIIDLNPEEWEISPKDGLKSLQIGRRSTEDGIYPDIDLWKFYFNDGDEYIARRHARIFAKEGKLYFQDLSGKGSTWYNNRDNENRLVKTDTDEATREIKTGDKLIISDSAVFVVHQQMDL